MKNDTREDVVADFHQTFGHPVGTGWTNFDITRRATLIGEESIELLSELYHLRHTDPSKWTTTKKADLLKEMADLQYVLSGLAVELGLDLQTAFIRVHKSNMSKLGEDGKPILREDGKALKGPNYQPPCLEDLV